jgi:hypothetical protein
MLLDLITLIIYGEAYKFPKEPYGNMEGCRVCNLEVTVKIHLHRGWFNDIISIVNGMHSRMRLQPIMND